MTVRCVAFLRGINVGGRVVKKERLQEVFEALGFEDVSTFRQSGNVVFETSVGTDESGRIVEASLRKSLGYDVPTFVRTAVALRETVDLDPFKGIGTEGSSFLVTFLPRPFVPFPLPLPAKIPKSSAEVISAKGAEAFSVTHGGGEGALPTHS